MLRQWLRCALAVEIRPSTSGMIARRFSTSVDASKMTKDEDFAAHVQSLMPKEEFKATLNPSQVGKLRKLITELELYVYMGKFIPQSLGDDEWHKLLLTKTITERVTYYEFLALRDRRREQDLSKKEEFDTRAYYAEQQAIYDSGGMGYGPYMYQLLRNPFRNSKLQHHIESSRVWSAMRAEKPNIALDFEFTFNEKARDLDLLGKQIQYVIANNMEARNPLPLSFVNFKQTEQSMRWLSKKLGFYTSSFPNQHILPQLADTGVRETFPDAGEIVYISRHAKDILDGPLRSDVYVLCVSMDFMRQSLGAARTQKFRPMRLPIQRYVKWQSGPMIVPFPNMVNIFREVYSSGGDWETALLNNIAKRHLLSADDSKTKKQNFFRQQRQREKHELIHMIAEATGSTDI